MANVKISALAALGGAPATGDLILMVDISDVSMAPSGTDKSMTHGNLLTFINASAGAFTLAISTPGVTITQGTITAQAAGLSQTVTWNNAAILFTADVLNVTNSASGSGSLLMDRQVGGVSMFQVTLNGTVVINGPSANTFTTTSPALALFGPNPTDYRIGQDSVGNTVGYLRHNVVATSSTNTWGHAFGHSLSASKDTIITDVFIGASGSLGVGIVAPGEKLNVVGNIHAQLLAAGDSSGIILTPVSGAPYVNFVVSDKSTRGNVKLTLQDSGTGSYVTLSVANAATTVGEVMRWQGNGFVGIGTITPGSKLDVAGSIAMSVAGGGLSIKSGANARIGESVLVGGTSGAVANTSVTANTKVRAIRRLLGGTGGFFSYTTTAGTGFTINSSSALDTSTVWWELVEMT